MDFHFNNRIARRRREHIINGKINVSYEYFIVNAFYDHNGKVWGCSQDPRVVYGENLDELAGCYIQFKEAFYAPILDFDKIPEEGARDPSDEREVLLEKIEEAIMEAEDDVLDGDDLRCTDEEIEKFDREQEEIRLKNEKEYDYIIKEYEMGKRWHPEYKLIDFYRAD